MSRPHRHGAKHDEPDSRDKLYRTHLLDHERAAMLGGDPAMFYPPVYDQGPLQSCTANAWAWATHYDINVGRHGEPLYDFMPKRELSRLWLYWRERDMEGSTDKDAGAMLRSGAKVLTHWAAGPVEDIWPYDAAKVLIDPKIDGYGTGRRTRGYYSLDHRQPDELNACLNANHPFVCLVAVHQSFEDAPGGVVPMPTDDEELRGFHAICIPPQIRGPTDPYRFPNSWGIDWGRDGWGTLPYEFVTGHGYCGSCWTMRASNGKV